MNRRALVLVAALAGLAVTVPAAIAAPDPGGGVSGDDPRVADLESAEVDAAGPVERGPAVLRLAKTPESARYLIRLADDAVPTYQGALPDLQRTAPRAGQRLNTDSRPVREYQRHLADEQDALVERMEDALGREVDVPFRYQFAVNGIAAELTAEEARTVAQDDAVVAVVADQERELHTDSGPVWSGAEPLWNAMAELGLPADVKGEGIVIGTIDTGISPGNQSFADPAPGDGYDHTNPLGEGNFLGVCNPDNPPEAGGFDSNFPCNDKLIGAYVFGNANPNGNSALDYQGHGSHTASTSGGNVVSGVQVEAPTITTDPFDISGVAPHANVISYLGCCTTSGLTASIEQAIIDEVDVINYSIGSTGASPNMWEDFDTRGFLSARAAGIFVATSAGNAGPGFATVGSPADAPWITSVGASTHNRHVGNALINLTSSAGNLDDIAGKSLTGPLPAAPIVNAADFDVLPDLPPTDGDPAALCGAGTQAEPVNPFAQGTFNGELVICDRGIFARVDKAVHLMEAGAGGIIHVNDAPNGSSLNADPFAIPGVHISFDDGAVLKDWLDNGASDHSGAVRGTQFEIGDEFGDIMAAFSSRGPNRAIDTLTPDVTAPGVDILAAVGADSYDVDSHGFISGTSMASPHVAGAGALLSQARPAWTPAQQQSALMTTARDVLNHDGTAADPYAQGAGHINIDRATLAGLLFDETFENYLAANPAEGGDPKRLNLPSFANTSCLVECSWQRTATAPASDHIPAGVTWTASTESDTGLSIDVTLDPATVSPGDSVDISVTANVDGAPVDETLFGEITLTPSTTDVPGVTMPVAVVPSSGVLPNAVEIDTRRDAGSHLVEGIESIEVTDFTGTLSGLVRGTIEEGALVEDPTNDDPYDDLSQVDVYQVDVPAGSSRLLVETVEAEMPDADLFVGTGATPSPGTEACRSTTPTAQESCDVADPEAGTWWILLQNWGGTDPATADAYTLAHVAIPSESSGNAGIVGPDGTVPVGEPYDIRIHWDVPEMAAGDRWYGTAALGSTPDTLGDIGSFPVTVVRHDDDVAKTASVAETTPGGTIGYEIEIQPNVTDSDLVYTVTDTVPDGLTIDPDSVTGGGVVDGQTITWEVEAPQPGLNYEAVTNTDDPSCASPLGGYFDLNGQLGFQPAPDVEGATGVFIFLATTPYHFYGEHPAGLGVTPHGFVLQGGTYGETPGTPQQLPDPAAPNGLVAPLWANTEIVRAEGAPGEERGITVASNASLAIVEFDRLQMVGQSDQVLGSYQLVTLAEADPSGPDAWIVFDAPGFLPADSTVGIEDATGERGTQVSEPLEDLWTAGTTICLDFVRETLDPITVGYDVTVDADAEAGTYTNAAVHTTDDPFAQPVTASTDVEVAGQAISEMTVSPEFVRLKGADQTQQFTATGHFPDGSTVDVTEAATWASDDEIVVTVDESGLATSIGGGRATVTATFDNFSDAARVHVTGRPADAGPGPRVSTGTLPELNVLAPYESTLTASRGTAPYSWSATGLPDGLTLDPDTGIITNDPSDPAVTDTSTATIDVTVTDAVGRTDDAELTLDIIGVSQVSAGWDHSCAGTADGAVYCWGTNFAGQLGDGSNDDSALPVRVAGPGGQGVLEDIVEVTTGWDHSCARTAGGTAYCWGANFRGQLGNDDSGLEADSNVPVVVQGPAGDGALADLTQISAGAIHTCAVTDGDSTYCWGSNGNGRLGDGTTTNSALPVQVKSPGGDGVLSGVVQVNAAAGHSCALMEDETAYCWGSNSSGRLGDGTTTNSALPVQVSGTGGDDALSGITQISGGDAHTCAVVSGGGAYCWGSNFLGRLGDGMTTNSPVPVQVKDPSGDGGLADVVQISAGAVHVCAATTDGTGFCWGSNGSGRLGDGTSDPSSLPAQVMDSGGDDGLTGITQINAGDSAHTCAVVGGAAWCWGNNDFGKLGDGSQTDRALPVPVHPRL